MHTALLVCLLVLGALCVYIGVFCILAARQGRQAMRDVPVDYLIILGAWLQEDRPGPELAPRIAYAADYMRRHPQSVAVATGGCFRSGQTKSEARVIWEGLVQKGIDPARILLEEEARITYDNFAACKAIIARHSGKEARIGVVTNTFHVLRAKKIAQQEGLSPVMLGAPSPRPAKKMYLRESIVMVQVAYEGIRRRLAASTKGSGTTTGL